MLFCLQPEHRCPSGAKEPTNEATFDTCDHRLVRGRPGSSPVTVFAQPSATAGTDSKMTTAPHGGTNDAKVVPSNKDNLATKDSAKVTGQKPGTSPAAGVAKTTGNHDKGA